MDWYGIEPLGALDPQRAADLIAHLADSRSSANISRDASPRSQLPPLVKLLAMSDDVECPP